jgi:nitroreductase
MSAYTDLIAARQSCRRYQEGRTIPREDLDAIIDAARLAPSACNSQPWHFTVVDTPAGVAAVAPCVQELGLNKFATECSALIVVTETPATLLKRLTNKPSDQRYAQLDIGIAVAHLVLAAADRGLSTCILGMFQEEKLKKILALPEKEPVRLVLTVGYAKEDDALRPKARKNLDEIRSYAKL